jgi:peptidoglycan/xylan/chitin deacetylase (PgdA/CDA1 family)
LTAQSTQDLYDQLKQNDNVLSSIIGVSPTYIRAPFGSYNGQVLSSAASWGYKGFIQWNVDSRDFINPLDVENHKEAIRSALGNANPLTDSFIILQHDVIESTAKELVPWIIAYVRGLAGAWRFVTIDQCLGVNDQYR